MSFIQNTAKLLVAFSTFAASNAAVTVREGLNTSPPGVSVSLNAGKYRISITRSGSPPVLLNIEGNNNDTIEYIRVNNTQGSLATSDIWLIIGPQQQGAPGIARIEELSATGAGRVSVLSMRLSGDFGLTTNTQSRLQVHRLEDVIIGGDLVCETNILPWTLAQSPVQPTQLRILGNLRESVFNDNSSIGEVTVVGDIIGPGPSARVIRAANAVNILRARSIRNFNIGQFNDPSLLDSINLLEVQQSYDSTLAPNELSASSPSPSAPSASAATSARRSG